jgi:rhamnogalacturonyl hydrolase YesR
MDRREFLQTAVGLAGGLPFIAQGQGEPGAAQKTWARHLTGTVSSRASLPLLEGKRAPFGWELATVGDAKVPPLLLAWPELPVAESPTHFRIAVGLDERDEKTVEVFLPQSQRIIGTMELRFVSQFQVYQLPLTPSDVADLRREGLALRLTRGSELEIFTGGANLPAALSPHLLVPGTAKPMEEFLARMNSLACVQMFGWMEGCVLDGLIDLSELTAHAGMRDMAQQHLALFFRDGKLIHENPFSVPSDGRIFSIEESLPFAALARLEPQNPMLQLPLVDWPKRRRPNGSIQDGPHLTSEAAYTVAWPMALIAKTQGSEALMQDALYQVRLRQAKFFDGREFWRVVTESGNKINRNWARGIAWQILGLTRTLTVAKERQDIGDLITHLQRFASWVIALQRPDGLWSVFAEDQKLTPDTAGSAGIAAALAIGARHGWLDERAMAAARATLKGLQAHLTPDGFLDGVSQSNKGGEDLQRSDYRSIYQMGMGLMAQLVAAIGE